MTETFRLADQIRRAFEGSAWHGDSVLELLADVTAKTAAARPIKDAHSIWEILLHIAAWDDVGHPPDRRHRGNPDATSRTSRCQRPSEAAWSQAIETTKKTHHELIKAVAAFPDSRLRNRFQARPRTTTTSTTCSAASCSTSFIMPARSLC